MSTGKGWIGPARVVENYLAVVGADRDAEGKCLVGGEAPSSFMGAGDELAIPAGCVYYVKGKAVPLAANMVTTLGEGAGRGLSCVVISALLALLLWAPQAQAGEPSLKWTLIPLAAGTSLDYISTDRLNAMNGQCGPAGCWSGAGYTTHELNPLPGMDSSVGRWAWGAAEVGGIAIVHRKSPRWARRLGWAFAALHVGMAIRNESIRRDMRRKLGRPDGAP